MSKFTFVFGALGLGVLLAGCGGPDYEGDQRFPLSGAVSFDGEPIDLGSISLIPTIGGTACGGVITDGRYSIPEEKGPTAGTYRVEIHWLKLTGKQLLDEETGEMYDQRREALPDKFHKGSDVSIEAPAPENTHDFDLKSS